MPVEPQQPEDSAEEQAPAEGAPSTPDAAAEPPDPEPPELSEDLPPQMMEALLAQAELERMTKMFVEDIQHVNCPVVGCVAQDDGSLSIVFQVGHNKFETFRIASQGQAKIVEGVQKAQAKAAGSSLLIADGPLPPGMTGQPPGPQQR